MTRSGPSLEELSDQLKGLDGRGYRAYKAITGRYQARFAGAPVLTLTIDHVQGDPFAEPSRVRAALAPAMAGLPSWAVSTPARRVATADFLGRKLWRLFDQNDTRMAGRADPGSGRSGELAVLCPGQQVLARSSLVVRPRGGADEDENASGEVEARFRVGLPAAGRRVLGRSAAHLLCAQLPALLRRALVFDPTEAAELRLHLETVEDTQALRAQLQSRGLVAFVANGSRLPRLSGVDDRPLPSGVTPFEAPPQLRVGLRAPNAGPITGMGIPAGVTLIVGGGYHGKSTLLRAIERGVYDQIPGDGRERVVTRPGAVKIRAEDGRRVTGVDISGFINHLPGGVDTRAFTSDNASGSTSQAAAIAEALEVGADCLLLDEDTSATNFMIRDARMQRLVASPDEPITPFLDRVRGLFTDQGISTILVIGGSGDYFDVADTVIGMRAFRPADVTATAKQIATELPSGRVNAPPALAEIRARVPDPASIDPRRGKRAVSIKTRSIDRVAFGDEEVDLTAVEQLVERAQTHAVAEALVWARGRLIDGRRTVAEALAAATRQLNPPGGDGLDNLDDPPRGDYAAFRVFELAAFLNRLRALEVRN